MEKLRIELLLLKTMIDNLEDLILKHGAPPLAVAMYCRRIMQEVLKVEGMAEPPPLGEGLPRGTSKRK